jgi:RND family efflux transporter MFP subunit
LLLASSGSVSAQSSSQSVTSFPTILAAHTQVTVLSRVSGTISSIAREEGERVRKDDVLAQIDETRYRLAWERASAEATRMRFTFVRKSQLSGQGVSVNEVEIAQAEYRMAQADSALRRLDLEHTTIRAPFAGYVTERRVQEGQWISPQEPVFTVVDPTVLWAVALVPEPLLTEMEVGDPVQVRIPDRGLSTIVDGRLHLLNPVADPGSGRIKITIQIDNRDNRLRPGMSAEILLPER